MSVRKILQPAFRLLMAGVLAADVLTLLPRTALAQSNSTTEIMCPEKAEPLVRVEYSYGIDRPSSFSCWYKSPPELAGKVSAVPFALDVTGKCWLKQSDEIADMRRDDSQRFTAGRQICSGDRVRCVVTCRPQ